MFLSREELRQLTGYKRPAEQRRWLSENGYAFEVRGDGRPALLWEQVRARQSVSMRHRATGPNLDALDNLD